MADKKFFPSFGYDRIHPLSARDRDEIAEHMGQAFTEDDFADMEHALDASEGAFVHLRDNAPSPKELEKRYDAIHRTAHKLRTLLGPSMIEHQADLSQPPKVRTRQDYAATNEAANRVTYRLRFPDGLQPDPPEAPGKRRKRVDEFEAFLAMLGQVSVVAVMEKSAINEPGTDGQPWKIVKERRSWHLRELIKGLKSVADRHGWKRYTVTTDGSRQVEQELEDAGEVKSEFVKLAFFLSRQLTQEARPKTVWPLVRMVREEFPRAQAQ